ncbi:MAG: type IV secretory system conjugative DNA transfer family protein [Lachnospiraceae bacterium]|nr:type IV secretory system conjugative DNA transfer family protein [Lachnospiraceae bacterium]
MPKKTIIEDAGSMVLAKDRYYDLDTYRTKVNNNVVVVGSPGAGKTRSIVSPNLLMAKGSYVVTDPKGNLYEKYGPYLRKHGYRVKKLDFTDPGKSEHYNFFNYIKNSQDILKVAHMLIYQDKNRKMNDPFWEEASQLLIQSIMAFLIEERSVDEQNLHSILKLVECCQVPEYDSDVKTVLDRIFEATAEENPDSYAVSMYTRFRVAAAKTLKSILISVNARLSLFDTPEINELTKKDTIDITSIGKRKTALFVVVSDTDRSLDGLINIFFTQTMNELCRYADKECEDSRLPVPVRFILDDFATNCRIEEFPRMIASIRSRGISAVIMIQAESQLTEGYGYDGRTIIGSCDTYVYLGGNDVETARAVSERCDMPLNKILNMPVDSNWIFRRGEAPYNGTNLVLDEFEKEQKARVVNYLNDKAV